MSIQLQVVFGISNLRRPIEYRSHKCLECSDRDNKVETDSEFKTIAEKRFTPFQYFEARYEGKTHQPINNSRINSIKMSPSRQLPAENYIKARVKCGTFSVAFASFF
uniref:Uncharacterized protein n=1 Tax=Glossina pallidipes TaxID=7398 RepID=A0A1A9Z532_GLOPL